MERLAWTAVVLAVVAVTCLPMWRVVRRSKASQAAVPPLPERPQAGCVDVVPPAPGVYVSSTAAGDWLDRISVRDLGVRSRAVLHVTPAGVSFDRTGASDVFVPSAYLRGVRREKGMAGKSANRGALVIVSWEHGDRLLDTGFRPDRVKDADRLAAAIAGLVTEGSAS